MSFAEFMALTPREVEWRIQAETEREDREFERVAQLACWVLNAFAGRNRKPITVKQLLRKRGTRRVEE